MRVSEEEEKRQPNSRLARLRPRLLLFFFFTVNRHFYKLRKETHTPDFVSQFSLLSLTSLFAHFPAIRRARVAAAPSKADAKRHTVSSRSRGSGVGEGGAADVVGGPSPR